MKGDFTKLTFQSEKHYTSVLMQQGRLQLDSDWNEQVDIQNHLRHTQTIDLIGANSGVPTSEGNSEPPYKDSFKISVTPDCIDLAIAPGRLYVNGILCELEGTLFDLPPSNNSSPDQIKLSTLNFDGRNLDKNQWVEIYPDANAKEGSNKKQCFQIKNIEPQKMELTLSEPVKEASGKMRMRRLLTYKNQPDYPNPDNGSSKVENGFYFAYIDVWQRHITTIEDPKLREVALINTPDTATRSQTVWQLKLKKLETSDPIPNNNVIKEEWENFIDERKNRLSYMNACAGLCTSAGATSNGRGYQRLENQLYRVEIHNPGQAVRDNNQEKKATFKWSRENGSIVSAIEKFDDNIITIRKSSQDAWTNSQTGQWLEITDEEIELKGKPGVLVRLLRVSDTKIEFDRFSIINGPIPSNATKVRRWDHITPEAAITAIDDWISLEAGIMVKFNPESHYETGDYWIIPARSATNDIEWSNDQADKTIRKPLEQLRQGIHHDYCLLALVEVEKGKFKPVEKDQDLRVVFPPLMRCLDKAGGVITGSLEIALDLSQNNSSDFISALKLTKKLDNTNSQSINFGFQNHNFVWQTNDQDRITITPDGNVGIGNPKHQSQLDINGTVKATQLEGNYLKLKNITVKQFSNDSNLKDDPESVPTEKAIKTKVETEISDLKKQLQTELKGEITRVETTLNTKADQAKVETEISDLKKQLQTELKGEITRVETTLDSKAALTGDIDVEFNAKSIKVERRIYAKELDVEERINSNSVLIKGKTVSGGFYQISSQALKEEINDLSSQEVTDLLSSLNPVKYLYKEDESKTAHAGFIAEDTPDLLTSNDKQTIKVVDLVAVLTKVVQDNQKTLRNLVRVVKQQQSEITALKKTVQELKTPRSDMENS
ncbi:hypothetical protein Cri9333_1119 [Crinalium epipsammum PCC 9333]|uniref:Peptidase S74 domain-containing protein n=1 Tax=Crinalium epipsammum PCC 9333 TaxID=1173022 RepID=K9VVB2_9CYAN|nr:DUF6519 domain-containing protein [Crinalium epipsammum]AFZ12028.1 hypothetical protein Cri9333_1119 [Crinalium epipsammum PCC 9333]